MTVTELKMAELIRMSSKELKELESETWDNYLRVSNALKVVNDLEKEA